MTTIALQIEGGVRLDPRSFSGVERLGEASTFEIEAHGPKDVSPSSVLEKAALLAFEAESGARHVAGVITRFSILATDHASERRYKLTLRSRFALLELRRPSRTFQELTVPEIVEAVVKDGGYKTIQKHLEGSYPKRRYVVQYQETDAAFVRRMCEEAGLYFRFEATEDGEAFILEDTSSNGPLPYPHGLLVVARTSGRETTEIAVDPRRIIESATGKVTLRDYDPDHPRVKLEGTATLGADHEKAIEHYEAPGGFGDPGAADARAKTRLESLRARASRIAFETDAAALAPGTLVTLSAAGELPHHVAAAGDYAVIGVSTRWEGGTQHMEIRVEAIPKAIAFRLAHTTPRPRIPGIQSAWVSGQTGHEIHPDPLGRVFVRFHWDVHGKTDHESSLPIRVMQPHSPGALIVPRIGWEIFAMFEDGDPDRPFVLGRSYNGKSPPPQALPANKTITSIATDSSPGAGARTMIQFDDAAGREHMLIHAPFAKAKKVAGKHVKQTMKNESYQLGGSLTAIIAASESISVHLAWLGSYGNRTINVGAAQYKSAGGNYGTQVGPEIVAVAGACIEQVGNPVKGAANLAVNTALARIGARGVAGAVVAAAGGVAKAAGEGYAKGGQAGAEHGALGAAAGVGMSFIPGGEAIMATVTGSSTPMPWDHGKQPEGSAEPGGGGAGASGGDGGPTGPGPGYRNTLVAGTYSELVCGAYAVVTPGSISWVTMGPATFGINGSHNVKASKAGIRALGGYNETLGSLNIDSKAKLGKKVLGLMRSNVSGALSIDAGGEYTMSAKASLTLNVTGSLQIGGSTVTFKCGGSEISTSAGGVKLKAGSIKITGTSKQSGSLTHK